MRRHHTNTRTLFGLCLVFAMNGTVNTHALPVSLTSESKFEYSNLPCPDSSQARGLVQKAKMAMELGSASQCDDSNASKILRLINWMSSYNVAVPQGWRGGASDALENPLEYFSKNSDSLSMMSLGIKGPLAYNQNKGRIVLSDLLFSYDPIAGIQTLIHEARHSSSEDYGHVKCFAGDVAHLKGACDLWFRNDPQSGAYAYEVMWSLGVRRLHPNLTLGVR